MTAGGANHPYLVPLYVYLRRCWGGRETPAPLQRTAEQLAREAGLWISPSGAYRALEWLKGDLTLLREEGWIHAWRLTRGPARGGMEDLYRLDPPVAPTGALADTG